MVTEIIGRAKVIVDAVVDSRKVEATGGKISTALKRASVVGVASFGVLSAAAIKSVSAFEADQASARKLENVLGNMGKAGAAESLDKLTTSLQRKTGADDAAIRSGETLLATFSEVAASAGEQGGVFERATRAAVDMAATGYGSIESASIQLGKALQDPIKGVAALNKSGVTFTADQKKMIEALVETGEAGKAQALILKEVEKQVKGSGEATATEADKIKQGFGEVESSVGNLLVALAGGKGKGKKSLSGVLFDTADALNNLAESDAWESIGDSVRSLDRIFDDFAKSDFGKKFADNQTKQLQGLVDLLNWIDTKLFRGGHARGNLLGARLELPPSVNRRASGGPASGLTLVGEQGPELLDLPSGSYVHSTPASQRMAASTVNNWNFYGPESLSEARRTADWYDKYGTRFGGATAAGGM